jgi:hypothetical protein
MKPAMVFCRPRLEIKPIEGFLGGHHAIDQKRSILTFDHVGLFALNLGTDRLARDRLEQDSFIDDRCQANWCLLELLQSFENPHPLVNEERLARRLEEDLAKAKTDSA